MMRSFRDLAEGALRCAQFAKTCDNADCAATISKSADSCLTDLLAACAHAGVKTDADIPSLARATGALLHLTIGHCGLSLGPTSNAWARTLAPAIELVEAEMDLLIGAEQG